MLSTTAKAQQRAKRAEKEKAVKEAAARADGDAMDTDPTTSTPATPGPSAEEKMDVDEKDAEGDEAEKKEEGEKKKRAEKEKVGYEVSNMSRVLPEQLRYISFTDEGRYEPVKKVRLNPIPHITTHADSSVNSPPVVFCSCLTADQRRLSSFWRLRAGNR